MSNENSFQYTYSAAENQEVLNIRKNMTRECDMTDMDADRVEEAKARLTGKEDK